MNIFKTSNFYNFLLYIIKDINDQSCVLICVQWWLTVRCILKRREYYSLMFDLDDF